MILYQLDFFRFINIKMMILKLIIAITLSIIVGSIFIYSGYTKLYPVIETFEFTFV